MKQLLQDALAVIRQELKNDHLLVSPEEHAFFTQKKENAPLKKSEAPSPKVLREAPGKPKTESLDDLKGLVSKLAPGLKVKEAIPDDAQAKKIATLWQEELELADVIILSLGEKDEPLQFLHNVAAAISSLLCPAKVIDGIRFEREKKWGLLFSTFDLKLVIAPEFKLWKESDLATFYRENPAANLRSLEKAPLLFLEPISSYLNNPQLKKQLWKMIVSQLSS